VNATISDDPADWLLGMFVTPSKRSKVHPLPPPQMLGSDPKPIAASAPTPELQLMDVSQQIRASASIHKYFMPFPHCNIIL
jgi:hypothetical protein